MDKQERGDESEDTLAPMQQQQQQQQQQATGAGRPTAGAAATAAAALTGRRGTVAAGGGGGGAPRRSIAGGMLGRATLMTLGNLARRSKAQEVRLENTYRMAPKDEDRLRCWKLRPLLSEALSEALSGYAYSPVTAGRKACDAALAIRERARETCSERYKIVVFVALMENKPADSSSGGGGGGGVCLASRALWSPGECADNYTEAACVGKTARAHATLHAFYHE